MNQLLAVLLGLLVGGALALPFALRVRRRNAERRADGIERRRPALLGTPVQRRRALWIAAGIAGAVVVARAFGAGAWTAPLLMLAILLTAQSVAFGLIAAARARRDAGRS